MDLGGGGGGDSANPVGVMKMLSFPYSFAYFCFCGFHENLKSKNTRDHSDYVLHHSIASDYYISIILYHTVASARHQHIIASDYSINILHQAYCISPMYHQPSHHLTIHHCQEYGGSAWFSSHWSDSVHMYLWS